MRSSCGTHPAPENRLRSGLACSKSCRQNLEEHPCWMAWGSRGICHRSDMGMSGQARGYAAWGRWGHRPRGGSEPRRSALRGRNGEGGVRLGISEVFSILNGWNLHSTDLRVRKAFPMGSIGHHQRLCDGVARTDPLPDSSPPGSSSPGLPQLWRPMELCHLRPSRPLP